MSQFCHVCGREPGADHGFCERYEIDRQQLHEHAAGVPSRVMEAAGHVLGSLPETCRLRAAVAVIDVWKETAA